MWEAEMTLIDGNGLLVMRGPTADASTWEDAVKEAYEYFVATPKQAQRLANPRDGDKFTTTTVYRP